VNGLELATRRCAVVTSTQNLFALRWKLGLLVDRAVWLCGLCATSPAVAVDEAAAPAAQQRPRWHFWSQTDLCGLLPELTWHHETRTVGIPLVHLLSKLLPCRCLYRGFVKTLRNQCEASPAVFELCRHMMLASLTGQVLLENVHCEQPRFEARCRLEAWARATPAPAMIEWMCAHPHVVFWSMKETLVAYVCANAPMREVVSLFYGGWDEYECDVVSVCDVLRAVVSRRDDMGSVDNLFSRQSSGSGYVHKLLKSRFEPMILAVSQAELHRRKVTQQRVAALTQKFRTACARVASRESQLSVAAMTASGVSESVARRVHECCVNYNSGTRSAPSALQVMEQVSLSDACALFALLTMRRQASMLQLVPLPSDTYRRQLQALRARSPTAQLPENAGCVYYCPTCDDLKCFCVQDAAVNVFAVGVPRVMLGNRSSVALHCNRKNDKVRRRRCGGSRLLSVNLRGFAVCWREQWYMLCPRCAAVCTFDLRRAVGAYGFSCGQCVLHDAEQSQTVARSGRECAYCAAPVESHGQSLQVLCAENPSGSERVWLCRKHRVSQCVREGARTREALLRVINGDIMKRATQL
jgi:hypothetical protein